MISSLRTFASRLRPLTGIVFDIDGVLLKGTTLIPRADEALQRLYDDDGKTPRIPVCFLTNGGGMKECEKAAQLSKLLGVSIADDQVVLCHTPMRDLSSVYGAKPVMLSGKGDLISVAKSYGFTKVVTTQQLYNAMPAAAPLTASHAQMHDSPCPVRDLKYGTEDNPFASVMVFTDPLDWSRDIQLITDVVISHGVPGRRSSLQDPWSVEVFVAARDLLWANEFPMPRYGLGAFSLAFQSLFQAYTGRLPKITHFGKPTPIPFKLTERLLEKQAERLGGSLEKIYMIGDNPAADVQGAKNCGEPWIPVLVQTGVFHSDDKQQISQQEGLSDLIISPNVFEFLKTNIHL